MVSIADGFGIDLSSAARQALTNAKFKLAYDKSYPIGTQDLAPIINEAKALNPDAFIAFSYPPDTLALTEQSQDRRLQSQGVLPRRRHGLPALSPEVRQEHRGRDGHRRLERRQPGDQGLPRQPQGAAAKAPSPTAGRARSTYASLQMLQQAIERVGKVDRAAVIKDLQTGTFDTVIGKVKLENNMPRTLLVGRPVAGRRVLRHRAGRQRGCAPRRSSRSRRGWRP